MDIDSAQTPAHRPLSSKLSLIVSRVRNAESRHDPRLRADRQVARPQTSLIALINGGRGAA